VVLGDGELLTVPELLPGWAVAFLLIGTLP
jgi:hypothetical protein